MSDRPQITRIQAPSAGKIKTPLGSSPFVRNGAPNYMKTGNSRIPFALTLALLSNVPLGHLREKYTERFSIPWWLCIHASIPLLVLWRRRFIPQIPSWFVPMNITAAVVGQLIGGKVAESSDDITEVTNV